MLEVILFLSGVLFLASLVSTSVLLTTGLGVPSTLVIIGFVTLVIILVSALREM